MLGAGRTEVKYPPPHFCVLLLAVLAAVCCGCGGDSEVITPTGAVSGYVYVPIGGVARSASAPAGYMALEGATVTIGRDSTTTDENGYYILTGVPTGERTITISKPGYATITMTVTVSKDETTVATERDSVDSVIVSMTNGSISVTSSPASATIYIDSVSTGLTTPQTLRGISAGAHTVNVSLDGYVPPATQTVTVSSGVVSGADFILTVFACYTDADCDVPNYFESCVNGGTKDAYCSYGFCIAMCNNDTNCNDLNGLTLDVCDNSAGDTCKTECAHIPVECTANSQCDDGNELTNDTCENAGTASAACSHTGCVACSSQADCLDGNALTKDSCSNPGTCAAACVNTPCSAACAADADCDDGNGATTDTCWNPGTCAAACTNLACNVWCDADGDCGATTNEFCVLPGTCASFCRQPTCQRQCSTDESCDDGNAATRDTCANPTTCASTCSHTACAIACAADSDCGAGYVCTNAGTCAAACLNRACDVACYSDIECWAIAPATDCVAPGTCDSYCRPDPAGM